MTWEVDGKSKKVIIDYRLFTKFLHNYNLVVFVGPIIIISARVTAAGIIEFLILVQEIIIERQNLRKLQQLCAERDVGGELFIKEASSLNEALLALLNKFVQYIPLECIYHKDLATERWNGRLCNTKFSHLATNL